MPQQLWGWLVAAKVTQVQQSVGQVETQFDPTLVT